jgi:hypothetical protein
VNTHYPTDDAVYFDGLALHVRRRAERDAEGLPLQMDQWQAAKYAKYAVGGGWRPPTVAEAREIIMWHPGIEDHHLWYWTATPAEGGGHAWGCYGEAGDYDPYHGRDHTSYVRLVRSGPDFERVLNI